MPKHIILTCLVFVLVEAVCLIGTIIASSKVKQKFCSDNPYNDEHYAGELEV